MKKPSLKFVEQHVVSWVMNQLEGAERAIDDYFDKDGKTSDKDIEKFIAGAVGSLEDLLDLYKPLEYVVLSEQYQYDEDDIRYLVSWAKKFIEDNDSFTLND